MLTQRRYVVRLYGKSRFFAGILEDARTGAETPFHGARELISLLRTPGVPSSTSLLPTDGLSNSDRVGGKRKSKHSIRKEDKA